MAKWEYCEVQTGKDTFLALYRRQNSEVIRIQRDKSRGDRSDFDAIARTVAELGLDDWEMVGVTNSDGTFQALFKRPVP
ncbi:MAG TPA: hypothetical protein VMU89_03285 [Thermomicrobiaceae bacterium]|nr:hypothetical protein [Thermomicrobiaceae bacterium]